MVFDRAFIFHTCIPCDKTHFPCYQGQDHLPRSRSTIKVTFEKDIQENVLKQN